MYEAHQQLMDTEEIVTAEAIKNKFTGKAEKPWMVGLHSCEAVNP